MMGAARLAVVPGMRPLNASPPLTYESSNITIHISVRGCEVQSKGSSFH